MTTDSLLIDCDGHILEPPAAASWVGENVLGENVARAYRLD